LGQSLTTNLSSLEECSKFNSLKIGNPSIVSSPFNSNLTPPGVYGGKFFVDIPPEDIESISQILFLSLFAIESSSHSCASFATIFFIIFIILH